LCNDEVGHTYAHRYWCGVLEPTGLVERNDDAGDFLLRLSARPMPDQRGVMPIHGD
jgi:hypothetical protein